MYSSVKTFFARPPVQWTVKTLLAIGAIGYLVYVIDPAQILAAFIDANWWWVAAALLLLPLNLGLEAIVWRQMLRPVTRNVSFRSIFEGLLCGFSLGVFTPARIGEFAGRAFYLPHADRWETTVTVLMQRFIDMAVAVLVGSIALALLLLGTDWLDSAAWWGFLAISATISVGLLLMLFFPARVLAFLERWISSRRVLDRLRLLKRIRRTTMGLALTLAFARYVVYVTQFAFLSWAFAPEISTGAVFGAVALVFLAKFLAPSITLMDLGIREGFAVFFFGAAGLSQVAGFNAALFIFILNVALPALLGIPYLLRMRLVKEEHAGASSSA